MGTYQSFKSVASGVGQFGAGAFHGARFVGETTWKVGSGFKAGLAGSRAGRAITMGIGEAFGMWYEHPSTLKQTFGTNLVRGQAARSIEQKAARLVADNRLGEARRLLEKSPVRSQGFLGLRGTQIKGLGSAGGTGLLWRAAPLAFTMFAAYEGYQQGGISGAAGGVASSVLWGAGIRLAGSMLGGALAPIGIGAAVIAAAGSGIYKLGEAAKEHRKNLRDIEFGGGQIMDAIESAGAATMRQRSLKALQNTHLNARMAMGNEALIMHRPLR